MTDENAIANVLQGLANSREAFLALGHWLERQAHVRAVSSGIDVRSLQSGVCMESFVEAELDTGNAVCWWLEIRESQGGWLIEPSIFLQHSAGQESLGDFAPRPILADAEFRRVLGEVTRELASFPDRALRTVLSWEPS